MAAVSVPGYVWTPLEDPEAHVRLMTILPGSNDEILELGLCESSIPAALPYCALSYECGAPGDVETILIAGRRARAPRNLCDFLRQLRSHFLQGRGLQAEFLWCDAICIDQNSKTEKNHQVRLMTQIYTHAQAVFAWLGEHADSSNTFFTAMNIYLREIADRGQTLPSFKDEQVQRRYAHMLLEIFAAEGVTRQALENLFTRSYWDRLWIVQEVVIPEQLYLFCGDDSLASEAWPLFNLLFGFEGIEEAALASGPELDNSPVIAIVLHRSQGRERSLTMDELLSFYWRQKCSNPHDYIYALLGLAKGGAQPSHGLQVDYGKSLMDLMADFTMDYNNRRMRLDALNSLVEAFTLQGSHGESWRDAFVESCRTSSYLSKPHRSLWSCYLPMIRLGSVKNPRSLSLSPQGHVEVDTGETIILHCLQGSLLSTGDVIFGLEHSLLAIAYHRFTRMKRGLYLRETDNSVLQKLPKKYIDEIRRGYSQIYSEQSPSEDPSRYFPARPDVNGGPVRALHTITYEDAMIILKTERGQIQGQWEENLEDCFFDLQDSLQAIFDHTTDREREDIMLCELDPPITTF